MVASYKHVVGAIIFIEFIMHFCYGFLYPPKYLNKLIKGFKNYLDVGTTLSGVLLICVMS
jgi:hypothetical protein